MASPMYDNAWLNAREKRTRNAPDQTRDIMHSPEEQARRRDRAIPEGNQLGFDPVEEARRYLDAPSVLDPVNVQDVAEVDRRMDAGVRARRGQESEAAEQALRNPYGASFDALSSLIPQSGQELTEGLASVGQGMQAGSLPAAFLPGAQGVAAGLGVGGAVAQIPDMLRRSLNNDPSDDPGVGEGSMALLGLLPGTGKAFQRGSKVWGISDMNRPMGPSRWQSATGPVDSPNFQRAPKVQPYSTPKPQATRPNPSSNWLDQMVREGGRTTPPVRPELAEMMPQTENAWSALRQLATRNEGVEMAGTPTGSILDIVSGGMKGPVTDLSNRLGGLNPAQARARQRFGRVFRSE